MDDWKRPEDRVLPTLADLLRRWQGRRLLGGREEVAIGAEVQTVRDGFLACRARAEAAERGLAQWRGRAEAAERDNARLREALKWYAAPETWQPGPRMTSMGDGPAWASRGEIDGGRRARAALRAQPGEETSG